MVIQEISLGILNGLWTLLLWTWWIIIPVLVYFAWRNNKKAKYVENTSHIMLSVKVPKNNDKGPIAAEMMFASLHGILQPKAMRDSGSVVQEHLSFEIVARTNVIEFFVRVPEKLKDFVEGQIYAQYPTAEISQVEDYSLNLDIDNDKIEDCIAGTEMSLVKNIIYPIKTFQNFDVDPLAGITGMLSKLEGTGERIWIQILAEPVDDDWSEAGLKFVSDKKSGKVSGGSVLMAESSEIGKMLGGAARSLPAMIPEMIRLAFGGEEQKKDEKKKEEKEEKPKLSHAEEVELSAIEEKASKLGFKVMIRVVYLAQTTDKAKERIQAAVGAFKQFNSTNLNGFKSDHIYTGKEFLSAYRARLLNDGFILNIEELASLYHLPHVSVETPNIVWTSSKKGEPPATLPYIEDLARVDKDITPLGMTTFRGSLKSFGIKRDDRRRHMYIIGKSGTGKSRLLENLAIEDIKRGEGVAVVDPHGELIDRILKYVPRNRINDVVYFNPADRDFPIAFNPLEATPEFREEVTNGFVSVLKKLFGYSWGPRLEYVLKHTVMALIEVEGSTMLGIVRMLTDKGYRKKIVGQITDPVVQMFWLKEFASYNDRMETETIAPILNKVGQFTASPIIRNIVGQPKSNIDFAKIMNEQKILLVDLSSGKIGEANSELLGSMIITKLQLAAMSRAYMKEEERKDFFLYVDEFQNFATESFAVILSEARKYRLSLTVANQYITQMEETVRDAVFGNVGTLISFRVGATDAAFLEKEFTPAFEQNDLVGLDTRNIYVNMMIDGVTSVPFSAMTIDSPKVEDDLSAVISAVSREKYGTPKNKVEEKIRAWYNVDAVMASVTAAGEGNMTALQKEASGIETDKKDNKPRQNMHAQSQPKAHENKISNINNKPIGSPKKISDNRGVVTKEQPLYKKIDKETLRSIIREVTTPGNSPIKSKTDKEAPVKKHDVVGEKQKTITKAPANISADRHKESETGTSKTTVPKNDTPLMVDNPPQTKINNVGTPTREDVVIREITPEEFHNLKTIHPHEKIKIKSEPQELKEGETVEFK